MTQLLRKISAATVVGGKSVVLETVFKDKSTAHPLYRVVGICNGTRTGKNKFDDKEDAGEWRALLGNFEATSFLTGEIFNSGVCFMPAYVVDLVAGQLAGDDPNSSVKFAFDIAAKFDDKAATSYTYFATSLIEPQEDDALRSLSKSLPAMPGNAKQVEGPKGKK